MRSDRLASTAEDLNFGGDDSLGLGGWDKKKTGDGGVRMRECQKIHLY